LAQGSGCCTACQCSCTHQGMAVACLACAAPDPPVRCTGCQIARFCSRPCQKAAWGEHRLFCSPNGLRILVGGEIAHAAATHHGAGENGEEKFRADAEVQAEVLRALGVREGGAIGQRRISDREFLGLISPGKAGLARRLFGRNAFRSSCLPLARAFDQQNLWPMVLSCRCHGHITELPTLELCAAIVTRILCVARRLREAGHRRLIFLGIGSGDALVEASVVLHLAAVLGVPVDLLQGPPLRLHYGEFEISIVATDTPDVGERRRNHTLEAAAELPVLSLDRREAVRRFAEEAPLYVFSCWMPMRAKWRADIEEDAGFRLAELCFLSAPPGLISVGAHEMISMERRTTELPVLTLNRFDFFARGIDEAGGDEAGFFHSQLYVIGDAGAARPFLAAPLVHRLGSYDVRMDGSNLHAVNIARGCGLSHIRGPKDLSVEIPSLYIAALLRPSDGAPLAEVDAIAVRTHVEDALKHLSGPAHRQLSKLLRDYDRTHGNFI